MTHPQLRPVALLLLLEISALLSTSASAQVSLPLDGYFRPGKCTAVMVTDAEATLDADGGVPTEALFSNAGSHVIPFLMLAVPADNSARLFVNSPQRQEFQLHALQSHERLVGITGSGNNEFAKSLFPSQSIIRVRLDSSHPLPGPTIAWESLDAVILDQAPPSRQIGELLAAGMIVAVQSEDRPDSAWPWQKAGPGWMLKCDLSGPAGSIGGDEAYLPLIGWNPGQPAIVRHRIVIVAALASLLAMATLLIRSRWSLVALVTVVIISAAAIEAWRRSLPALRRAAGEILVARDRLIQSDLWQYARAPQASDGVMNSARPILGEASQAERIGLKMLCRSDARVDWMYQLPAGDAIALLDRRVEAAPERLPAIQENRISPLRELARGLYLHQGEQIAGEITIAPDDAVERWPAVVIQRRD